MNRVDAETIICKPHEMHGCITCMVDDYYDWEAQRAERRRQRRQAWREMPVSDRFDLGGEG